MKQIQKKEKEEAFPELTKEEVEEIKNILYTLRPQLLDRKEYQYSYDIEKKSQTFVYSYEFLFNLISTIKNEGIIKKLKVYLDEFKKLYEKNYYLTQSLKIAKSEYTKNKIIKTMISNYNQDSSIEVLISFMRPLGKRIQMFNPEQDAGLTD